MIYYGHEYGWPGQTKVNLPHLLMCAALLGVGKWAVC